MDPGRLVVPVECRASAGGPVLHGVILTEGRAARGGRAELFAPGACVWPSDGVAIRAEHLGHVEARAVPTREGNEVHVEVRATDAIRRAVDVDGKRYMSVEFTAEAEVRTAAGVREIERAFLTAAALTDRPEYVQTSAEVRDRRRRVWL